MKKYNPAPIRATIKIAVMFDILPNLRGLVIDVPPFGT
tara:strand:+ start:390 stop:503 length:114 start_codon:yes stop_codon:yes gene_type:complete